MVEPPTVEETVSILRGLRERYELHHGVKIKDEALVMAAKLSDRYIADRFLPGGQCSYDYSKPVSDLWPAET